MAISTTTNLGLTVYTEQNNEPELFIDYVAKISGTTDDSNMIKIDSFAGEVNTQLEELGKKTGIGTNLLQNGYLNPPINRNGRTAWPSVNGPLFDSWTGDTSMTTSTGSAVTIESTGVKVLMTTAVTTATWPLLQELSEVESLIGKTVTISAKIGSLVGTNFIFGITSITQSGTWIGHAVVNIDKTGIISAQYTIPANTERLQVGICAQTTVAVNDYCILSAVKAEIGTEQTLGHLDDSGNWVLNEAQSLWFNTVEPTGISNANLLTNWYFANPVNDNGQSSYNSNNTIYDTINDWKMNGADGLLAISSGYIRLTQTSIATTKYQSIYNTIGDFANYAGKSMVLSMLVRGVGTRYMLLQIGGTTISGSNIVAEASSDWTLVVGTFSIPTQLGTDTQGTVHLYADASSSLGYTDFQGVKLELGSIQTLAHKEGNNWVLNEAQPKSWVTTEPPRASNINILDNWYFADLINQKGQASYTGAGYTVDRFYNSSLPSVTVNAGHLTLAGAADGDWQRLEQRIEKPQRFNGCTLTLSVLYRASQGGGRIALYCSSKSSLIKEIALPPTESLWGIAFCSATIAENYFGASDTFSVMFYPNSQNQHNRVIDLKAAKLELGAVQTLAHQENGVWVLNDPPPNPQQELAKCQRYFVNLNPNKYKWFALPIAVASNATVAYGMVNTPVPMRAVPTIVWGGIIHLSRNENIAVTNIKVSADTTSVCGVQLQYFATGLTENAVYRAQGGADETAYIWLDANL